MPAPDRTGLRVAMIGVRGVPANWGGADTATEEIGRRLAARGDEIVVYCRRHNSTIPDDEYLGMRRIVLPSINTFNFDTVSHSFLSVLHLLVRDTADVVHFHGMGNALMLPLFAFSRKKTIVAMDGKDWERPKWGPVARLALRLSMRVAVWLADYLIIDNRPTLEWFEERFDEPATYLAHGANFDAPSGWEALDEYDLEPGRYVLFVGALVPDKGPDVLIDAYRQVPGDMPLVVVGDSDYFQEFRDRVRATGEEDPRVRFLGFVYGDAYKQLVANAYVYVQSSRIEGTSPALLQAMGYGRAIVLNGTRYSHAVAGDAARTYQENDPADLAQKLEELISDPGLVEALGRRARERAREEYSWDAIAEGHRAVYSELAAEVTGREALAP